MGIHDLRDTHFHSGISRSVAFHCERAGRTVLVWTGILSLS